jgi:hypothetical protein
MSFPFLVICEFEPLECLKERREYRTVALFLENFPFNLQLYITTMAEYFCLLASLDQVFSISLNIA